MFITHKFYAYSQKPTEIVTFKSQFSSVKLCKTMCTVSITHGAYDDVMSIGVPDIWCSNPNIL